MCFCLYLHEKIHRNKKTDLTFVPKSLKIIRMEGWQSGNAPDSKSGEPANTGAQVQILYLPFILTKPLEINVSGGFFYFDPDIDPELI